MFVPAGIVRVDRCHRFPFVGWPTAPPPPVRRGGGNRGIATNRPLAYEAGTICSGGPETLSVIEAVRASATGDWGSNPVTIAANWTP